MKAVALLPGSPLHQLAKQWQQQPAAAAAAKGAAAAAAVPPSALEGTEGLTFQLKTQAVCLTGWDLPSLLPDVAALPPLQLLPTLVEDVAAALQHAQQQLEAASSSDGSRGSSSAVSAMRWALKRCIRAAFELHLCCGCSSAGDSSTGSGRVFTRDLYWCQQHAAEQHPELKEPLAAALRLYVELADGSTSGGSDSAACPIDEEMQAAARLAGQIDSLFLQRMLAEEPGWLSHHHDSQLAPTGGQQGEPAAAPGSRSMGDWAQRIRVQLWVAAAAASGGSLEDSLLGAPPPPVTAVVGGIVLTLDWSQPAEQQQAMAIIAATAAAPTDPASLLPSSSSGSLAAEPQAVLLKGAATEWPAVRRWTLGRLAAAGLKGRARVAPSLQFPFTEPRLASILAEQRGALAWRFGRVGGRAAVRPCVSPLSPTHMCACRRGGTAQLPGMRERS